MLNVALEARRSGLWILNVALDVRRTGFTM